jgi:uncharacterized protein (DUF1810 family)
VNERSFFNLLRFIDAQRPVFTQAMQELRAGRKTSHWMWFIFPQLRGLGCSVASMIWIFLEQNIPQPFAAIAVTSTRMPLTPRAATPIAARTGQGLAKKRL